jgi:6,7-dimethyl-8-ribityllumazine synthase
MHKAQKGKFEKFSAHKYRVALVVAQFNRDLSEALLSSALAVLRDYGVDSKNIAVGRVAGAVEIPVILQELAQTKKYDCLVALGVVIKGDTEHFHYVSQMVADGVMRVTLDYNLPVGFGVLTVNNIKQAKDRIAAGGEAAEAALQTANLLKSIK